MYAIETHNIVYFVKSMPNISFLPYIINVVFTNRVFTFFAMQDYTHKPKKIRVLSCASGAVKHILICLCYLSTKINIVILY